jgi:hypothetical protein
MCHTYVPVVSAVGWTTAGAGRGTEVMATAMMTQMMVMTMKDW